MSKVQNLRALINQRLSAAAEEIFGLFEGTIAEYEEELRRQRKLLTTAFNPEVRLNRADVQLLLVSTKEDPPEQQEWSPILDQEDPPELQLKEKEEELWASPEREQLEGLEEIDITNFTFTAVPVKIEEDDEEKPLSSQLDQSQIKQIKTETGGEDCAGPEPDRNLDPDDEEKPQPSQLHQSQTEQSTEVVGEDCGGPRHDSSSDFSESESDSDDLKKSSEPQSGLDFMKTNSGGHTGEKSFRCTECGKQFSQSSNLKRHTRIHTGENLFSCPVCNKRFLQRVRLTHHMARHTGEKLFSCSICEQRFTWIYQLESHACANRQSSQLLKSQTEESRDVGHLKTETDGDDWERPEPTTSLSPHSHLQSETDDSCDLEETRKPQSGLNPLQCDNATVSDMESNTGKSPVSSSSSFVHKVHLQKHIILQTGAKPFSCSVCGKRYPWKQSLTTHMKLHSEGKHFNCSVCKKKFRWRGEVVRHMRIHTGEKPFSCSHCGKSFSQRSSLNLHLRVHSDEKPFSCTVCKKSFRWGGEIERHMRTHTGEKPYTCSFCGMRFTQNSSLSTHLKLHTGEKPFACSVCKASFSRKANLSLHMRIHTGEKPFRCSGCDRSFTQQPAHIKKHKCPGKTSISKEVL